MGGWDDTFSAGLDGKVHDLLDAMAPALALAAEPVRSDAVARAPIREGNLRGSAELTVTGYGMDAWSQVRFPGPYARRQHYELTWKHPRGGQALYLYTALLVHADDAFKVLADSLRRVM